MSVLLLYAACWFWGWLNANAANDSVLDRLDSFYKAAGGVIVFTSATIGLLTYYRSTELEEAKWLGQLHEKFFEKSLYARMRMLIDYKHPRNEYDQLKLAIKDPCQSTSAVIMQERFVAYLNFFEYIATLWQTRQLRHEKIYLVFGYYLRTLGNDDNKWIIKYAEDNDFKNLPSLVTSICLLDKKRRGGE